MARKNTTVEEPTTSEPTVDATEPQTPDTAPPDVAGTAAATSAEPAERHGWWRFAGARDRAGNPLEYFPGIPARDLAPADVAGLDDERYGIVEASRLYDRGEEPPAEPTGSGDGHDDPPEH